MRKIDFVSVHEMASLDPNTRDSDSSAATPLLKLLCPNLVRLSADWQIEPDIAQSWVCSGDGLRYRFQLRPGLTFHNGDPLDAKAVVCNFERIFDPRNDTPLREDLDALSSVEAIGDHEVLFTLRRPFPAFLHYLAGRCHLAADTSQQPVGAGPFRLVEWKRGSHILLKRFEGYWHSKRPWLDEVSLSWAPDAAERIRRINVADFDIMESVPASSADRLGAQGLVHVLASVSTSRFTLAFNCARPPFDSPILRRAIAESIDCTKLVEKFIAPYGQAGGWSAPDSSLQKCENPERVRKLLADAGYPEGLTVRAVSTQVSPLPHLAAEIGAMLEPLGIRLDVRTYDDPPWWPYIYLDTDWDIAFQTMGTRAHSDMLYRREFASHGKFNATGYKNKNLDALISHAQHEQDKETRKKLYAQAKRILDDDVPVLVLCTTDTVVGTRPGVQNYEAHPLGYWNLQDVVVNKDVL